MARGEQNAATECEGARFEADRAGQYTGVVEVVENEQCVGPVAKFLERDLEPPLGRLAEDVGSQPGTDSSESFREWFGGVDPKDAAWIIRLVSIDIFHGELGLAYPPHAGEPGWSNAHRLGFLKGRMQSLEVLAAADEVGIAGKRDEEWWARRGSSPINRRA
jgi:hypothetical protein